MTNEDHESVRRRLMFVPGEDFYFLAYTILLVFDELGCRAPERRYRDVDGIAYLADLISHEADLKLALSEEPLSPTQRSRLCLLYDRASARRAPFQRVLAALAERGFIDVMGTDPRGAFLKSIPPVRGLDSELFAGERSRIAKLRKVLRLSNAGRAKVQERLFEAHGVQTWND